MMCYSVQCRDQIFVKVYGILSFDKDMDKNIGKNLTKSLSSKYSQKILNHAKQSPIGTSKKQLKQLKTASKRTIPKWLKQLVIWLAIKLLMQ